MGATYRYACPACGLTAEVGGGDDQGMRVSSTTIWCPRCERLEDAVTARIEDGWQALRPRCRRRHVQVVPWADGDPCPRCGGPLPPGELVATWD